jgi:O-acetyl-ADP-ribose deacetylase (regulator of RNase III)
MIEFKHGDLLADDAEALVNTVNCVGVMGRGVALQFKNAFPANFDAYVAACRRGEVQPGRMFVFETGQLMNPRFIINFPTKRDWRGKSRLEDIEKGLVALVEEIRARDIRSIAIPPLGAGLGGLDWGQVRLRIINALKEVEDLHAVVYEPVTSPGETPFNRSTTPPNMTVGRALLIVLMDRYLQGLLDPFVTLLEIHKLMYFLQAAGEPLKLKYTKAHYGPYAANLRHVLKAVEGHLVSGYADGGDAPEKQLTLLPGALDDSRAFLEEYPETQANLVRVSNLVEGFESPFGLELLSTVHWVIANENVQSEADAIAAIYAWSDHKKQFSQRQIAIAFDVLTREGWTETVTSP